MPVTIWIATPERITACQLCWPSRVRPSRSKMIAVPGRALGRCCRAIAPDELVGGDYNHRPTGPAESFIRTKRG
jgi:hypothetical protein